LASQSGDSQAALSVPFIYLSGVIFGGCVATAVASTTSFIKHNLPQSQWIGAITVFTSIFAVGQIVGPSLTGWVSDRAGTLSSGFLVSAGILLLGSVLALWQKPLQMRHTASHMGSGH
jgi:MFS family permease